MIKNIKLYLQFYGNDVILNIDIDFAKAKNKKIRRVIIMTKRAKEIAKNENLMRTCFVDGCKRVQETCKGQPGSYVCASCRLKKNYLGVES